MASIGFAVSAIWNCSPWKGGITCMGVAVLGSTLLAVLETRKYAADTNSVIFFAGATVIVGGVFYPIGYADTFYGAKVARRNTVDCENPRTRNWNILSAALAILIGSALINAWNPATDQEIIVAIGLMSMIVLFFAIRYACRRIEKYRHQRNP